MNSNGIVIRGKPENLHHTHQCYTCKTTFSCSWPYCKDQFERDCDACRKQLKLLGESSADR